MKTRASRSRHRAIDATRGVGPISPHARGNIGRQNPSTGEFPSDVSRPANNAGCAIWRLETLLRYLPAGMFQISYGGMSGRRLRKISEKSEKPKAGLKRHDRIARIARQRGGKGEGGGNKSQPEDRLTTSSCEQCHRS